MSEEIKRVHLGLAVGFEKSVNRMKVYHGSDELVEWLGRRIPDDVVKEVRKQLLRREILLLHGQEALDYLDKSMELEPEIPVNW